MQKWSLLSALLFFGVASALADEPALLTEPNADKPIIFGNIDIAYNYLSKRNHFTSGTYNHANDISLNGIALQAINVTFSNLPKKGFGELINILVGQDANYTAPIGYNPNIFNIENIGGNVPQAFIQYKINNTKLQVGEQLSLVGIEEIDYVQNPQFSRSLLNFFAQPGTHLGIRVEHVINNTLILDIGTNNGWNTFRTPGRQTSVEANITYIPSSALSLSLNGTSGKQYLSTSQNGGRESLRQIIDFFATWYATTELSFAINTDYAMQSKAALPDNHFGRATWKGIAGYVNYTWREKWLASMRAELFNDTNGYTTGVAQNLREITLTLAYSPLKHLQIRAETRRDFSNKNVYVNKNNAGTSNNIQAYSLDLLFTF